MKKIEFSKAACAISSGLFMLFGVWMVVRYYSLVKLAIENNSSSLPDAALPIAGVTFVFSPLLSYLLYQWGLKNSRNKYGVDETGQPFKKRDGE